MRCSNFSKTSQKTKNFTFCSLLLCDVTVFTSGLKLSWQTSLLWNFIVVEGWGFTDVSGQKADTLQKVELSVVDNNYCDSRLNEEIWLTQICTYTPGKDSCFSDSGGPLLWKGSTTGSGKLELVGIISYGVGCATSRPAVNTRVTAFLSWIVSVSSGILVLKKLYLIFW